MAINFLNNVDYNKNQLLNPRIQNEVNDNAAGTPVSGQLYYNTTDKVLKYGKDDGTGTIVWSVIDTDTGITSIELASGGNATSGNTITDNGTLNLSFNGASTDYVNGQGDLVVFPTIPTVPSNIVETIVTTNGAYINLTPTTAASGDVTITADLSASGTPGDTVYLRGDNAWAPISGIPGTYSFVISDNASPTPVTGTVAEDDTVQIAANADLTSNLTGETTASKLLTVGLKVDSGLGNANNYVLNQGAEVATADDTIPFNDYTPGATPPSTQTNVVKKTTFGTIPVTALTEVKTYIDNAVAGGLIYQGGFDGSTGFVDGTTDYLDNRGTQIAVNKGWTYTVTVAGTFYGENVEVGDVLIAEDDLTSGTGALTDWTTVQNNIDLASLTQVGIGNVIPATANTLKGLSVTYSNGTATAGLDIAGLTTQSPANNSLAFIPFYDQQAGANLKVGLSFLAGDLNEFTSKAYTISDTATITYPFTLTAAKQNDTIIQLVDTVTNETVYADVDRISTTQATITFASTPANDVRVLVQKIG